MYQLVVTNSDTCIIQNGTASDVTGRNDKCGNNHLDRLNTVTIAQHLFHL